MEMKENIKEFKEHIVSNIEKNKLYLFVYSLLRRVLTYICTYIYFFIREAFQKVQILV